MSGSYQETPFRLRAEALAADFEGTPQQFIDALVDLLSIVSPEGYYGIVVSDSAPASNVGLWLQGGTKPYVWDVDTNAYVPLDVSDSIASALAAIAALQATVAGHTTQITALQAADTTLGNRITTLEGYAAKGRLVIASATPAVADRGSLWVETNAGGTAVTALKFWDGTSWGTVVSFPVVTSYATAVGGRQALPSPGGKVTFAHGLGARPNVWGVGIVCDASGCPSGYAVGDYVPVHDVRRADLSETDNGPSSYCNATEIGFVVPTTLSMNNYALQHKTTFDQVTIDTSKWKVTAFAQA